MNENPEQHGLNRSGRLATSLLTRHISPQSLRIIEALPDLPDPPKKPSKAQLRQRAELGASICQRDGCFPDMMADALCIPAELIVAELTWDRKEANGEQMLKKLEARALARTFAMLEKIQDAMDVQLDAGKELRFGDLVKGADVMQRTIAAKRRWNEPDVELDASTGKTLAGFLEGAVKGGAKVTIEGPKPEDQAIEVKSTEPPGKSANPTEKP